MLERVQDAPAQTLALRASGTVMARDIEAAIEAALGGSEAATGLVIVIDPDFDDQKNAQNQATKNITSEAMNRIMPKVRPWRTSTLW